MQNRLQKIDRLFESALELSPETRGRFLDEECAGDLDLRQEVESLLRADECAGDFISESASDVAARMLAEEHLLSSQKQVMGQYRLEGRIGSGGMGQVYLASDKLGRKLALKLLRQRFPGDENGIARFQLEAQTLLSLNHPNIVTIHDIGQTGGVHYIASELVEGETLRQHLDKGVFELEQVLDFAIQVATALAAAHEKGIVHRDIKPENIMIRHDGYVKVLDFGIAKLKDKPVEIESGASTLNRVDTAEGTVVGTAPYMSPEQARGLAVDERTDIWSLGVVIYESLTGRKPFWGDTAPDVINAVIGKVPTPLKRYVSDVPESFERIVSRTLCKEKESRYQTANELLLDLKELRRKVEFAKSVSAEGEVNGSAPRAESLTLNAGARTSPQPVVTSSAEYIFTAIKRRRLLVLGSLLVLAAGIAGLAFYRSDRKTELAIDSIAVLPFKNESDNTEVEYLSDGMTESLINSLSQVPNLSVKAHSTVIRYKGRVVEPQIIARELSVHAILNGRVVQHGDGLTLYLSLVDGRNGNQLWGEQYDRKLRDLVSLQNEIARDVSHKVRARLSGADEQKLARNYTDNSEAYHLYLKGRYHYSRLTRPDIDKAIAYYQQSIAIDPSYALAYIGLSLAYRALALTSDVPSNETMPKAKAAALRAIEIDETLSEAHAALAVVNFWYDWDLKAAEKESLRAIELDPNKPTDHSGYAQILSSMGQHEKALIQAKHQREIDPLNLRTNSVEGQIMFFAGRYDDAIDRLQKTIELEPNFWLPHLFLARVYIEKEMHTEALAEANRAKTLSGGNAEATAHVVYALAKSGKQREARATLDELKKRAALRDVPPYAFALAYNGLNETDQTIGWLEKGLELRDVRMVLLTVDPKWNNLRSDSRFQDVLRRAGFVQ